MIILGSFCSIFNWERADIWLQIGIGKSFSDISLQMPRMTTAFEQWFLCAAVEVLLNCSKHYCEAMATIRLPHCALLERGCHGVVLSMLKVRPIGLCSMRSNRVHWRCHCVATEMLAIVLRPPRRSASFLNTVGLPWDHCSGVTGVLANSAHPDDMPQFFFISSVS